MHPMLRPAPNRPKKRPNYLHQLRPNQRRLHHRPTKRISILFLKHKIHQRPKTSGQPNQHLHGRTTRPHWHRWRQEKLSCFRHSVQPRQAILIDQSNDQTILPESRFEQSADQIRRKHLLWCLGQGWHERQKARNSGPCMYLFVL